jgi:hypothetical protein
MKTLCLVRYKQSYPDLATSPKLALVKVFRPI